MKCFSMFSGIGGFDLALQNLGHEMIGACEIDRYARQIYAKQFPRVKIWEDATKINPTELPEFELLCAGFPCQAFSMAGKRLGFEDTRGTLFYEIARIAREKKPSYLFLENVKGLLNHDNGRTFATIISTFYDLGYDVEWQVFNSKYFVPQNRERIFIIGHFREKPTRQIFPIRENDTINDKSYNKEQAERKWVWRKISGAICSNYKKGEGTGTMIYHNQPNMVNRIQERINTCALTSTFSLLENEKIRMLTPLECERLQGFPDNWTDGISDTQRYKCIGNAVTVPVIEYIAKYFEDIK